MVAYYFPPMGLSGVQRISKFVKYLPDFGWQPTVLTARPAGYFAFDASLVEDAERRGVHVESTASWDPTRLFARRRAVALPGEGRRRWLSLASQSVFLPDNKIGWLRPGFRAGRRLVMKESYDLVLATAPPYSALLLAAKLSRRHGLPLVADLRDDWVGNPRHIYPTRWHRARHEALEASVLSQSSHVIAINEEIEASLRERARAHGAKCESSVIPQGFDPESLQKAQAAEQHPERMRLVYTGVFYDAQTPDYFLKGLHAMLKRNPPARSRIEAVFVGLVPEASRRLIRDLDLEDVVSCKGYLSHSEAVSYQLSADVLWMTIGERPGSGGISTGKLFEYMGTRKPILALIPPGTARKALHPYGANWILDPADIASITQALSDLYDRWESGTLPQGEASYAQTFDRKRLTGELAGILDACAVSRSSRRGTGSEVALPRP